MHYEAQLNCSVELSWGQSNSVAGFKDRQQSTKAILVGSRYNGDCYLILEPHYMYYIPHTAFLSGLFIDIIHVNNYGI